MERKVTISYNWNGLDLEEIPAKHVEALKEAAMARIIDRYQQGYTSGELNESVRFGKEIVPEEDEDDGLSYSGWFNIKEEEVVSDTEQNDNS